MNRGWTRVADVVLSLALLVAAVVAAVDGHAWQAVAGAVLALAWGVVGVRRLVRRHPVLVTPTASPAATSRSSHPVVP